MCRSFLLDPWVRGAVWWRTTQGNRRSLPDGGGGGLEGAPIRFESVTLGAMSSTGDARDKDFVLAFKPSQLIIGAAGLAALWLIWRMVRRRGG